MGFPTAGMYCNSTNKYNAKIDKHEYQYQHNHHGYALNINHHNENYEKDH